MRNGIRKLAGEGFPAGGKTFLTLEVRDVYSKTKQTTKQQLNGLIEFEPFLK